MSDKCDALAKYFEDKYYRGTFKRSELSKAFRDFLSQKEADLESARKRSDEYIDNSRILAKAYREFKERVKVLENELNTANAKLADMTTLNQSNKDAADSWMLNADVLTRKLAKLHDAYNAQDKTSRKHIVKLQRQLMEAEAVAAEKDAALKVGIEQLKQTIKACGPCDHSVNICVCGLIENIEKMKAALSSPGSNVLAVLEAVELWVAREDYESRVAIRNRWKALQSGQPGGER